MISAKSLSIKATLLPDISRLNLRVENLNVLDDNMHLELNA